MPEDNDKPVCLNYTLPSRIAGLARQLGFTDQRAKELRKIFMDDIMHIDKAIAENKPFAALTMGHTLTRIQLCERTQSATEQYFLAAMFGYDMAENDHKLARMKALVDLTDMLPEKAKEDMPEDVKAEYLKTKEMLTIIESMGG